VRIANTLVTALLSTAVIAEGAYIIKTHRQMDALSAQVQQLAAEAADAPAADLPRLGARVGDRPTGGPARLPPPRFTTAAAQAYTAPAAGTPGAPALPPALDTPEAREQLRQFVAAELAHEREDWRQRQQQARDEEAQRRLEAAIKTLGLNGSEAQKLTEVVTNAQEQRRALRDKIQAGQIARTDVPKEMMALRDQTDKQLRDVLGDEKAQKFQELQRQNGGPGPGGPVGGFRRAFGGQPPPPGPQP
jgi:hypothetical protein